VTETANPNMPLAMGEVKAPPRIMTRKRALACLAMNLLAFPGLGTIMARRWIGYVQAVVMVAGFCLFVGFMGLYFISFGRFAMDSPDEFRAHYQPFLWALLTGLGLCLVAWLWSLLSSLLILRDARLAEEQEAQIR
jgi:hypothetical protein